MPEEAPASFGKLCQPAHVIDDGPLEFVLAACRWLAGHGVLEIDVQTLVRVEFGAVGRRGEDPDLVLARGQPVPHRLGPVDGQVVPDQERLAVGLLDEPPEKADQARGLDAVMGLPLAQ